MKKVAATVSLVLFMAVFAPASVTAQQAAKAFAAITVADLAKSEEWYSTHLGATRMSYSRSGSGHVENVMVGNAYLTIELIHFTAAAPSDTVTRSTREVGLQKAGVWIDATSFDATHRSLQRTKAEFIGGVITDSRLNARSMLVRDNSGVIIQFFCPVTGSAGRHP